MERDVSIAAMMDLPRLTGSGAVTLGQLLLAAAKAKIPLPIFLERPRARLEAAVNDLIAAVTPDVPVDSKAAKKADRKLDAAWRALFFWLKSLLNLTDDQAANLDKVREFFDLCFKNGLSFIVLSYREEWTESEARLKAAADGGYEPLIRALGGGPLLDGLKSAHEEYGQALGVKTPLAERPVPLVRAKMDLLSLAMKTYTAKVVTWADPEEPGSEALSKALIAPLVHWKDLPVRSKGDAGETDEGETGDTPAQS